ncbi:putative nuclease HARBI1 [Prorops nasuta]|uniref:putative nuclease HARBI1 n=1 Tax=Prorops nasuta TaxID=863751 RepID=UPI0034CDC41B
MEFLKFETSCSFATYVQLQILLSAIAYDKICVVITLIGISETSAVRTIHRVTLSIAELHMEYIKFPSHSNHILRCQIENFKLSGFVRVIGAIDCFHVRIRSYGGENSELFRNRKGFFSINVQAIVNSRLQIMDLVARWPGSIHDATIFDNSRIKKRFENGEFGNAILLGDSGYPNLPYLLTPLNNSRTRGDVLYNEAHIRTRCMVERCFGILGKKFPILTMGSRFWKPSETLPVITACVILHNLERCSSATENCDIYNNAISNLEENLHEQERLYIIENYFERLL